MAETHDAFAALATVLAKALDDLPEWLSPGEKAMLNDGPENELLDRIDTAVGGVCRRGWKIQSQTIHPLLQAGELYYFVNRSNTSGDSIIANEIKYLPCFTLFSPGFLFPPSFSFYFPALR